MVSLEALWASRATAGQGGVSIQDLIYRPDWFVKWDDTCSDPIKAHEIERGCVTPRDRSRIIVTSVAYLEGLLYEAGSRMSLIT